MPFEPSPEKRARRAFDAGTALYEERWDPALAGLRVLVRAKLANEATKEVSDKPHGSAHAMALVPAERHEFSSFRPARLREGGRAP